MVTLLHVPQRQPNETDIVVKVTPKMSTSTLFFKMSQNHVYEFQQYLSDIFVQRAYCLSVLTVIYSSIERILLIEMTLLQNNISFDFFLNYYSEIEEFQKIVGSFIEVVDTVATKVEKEKLKVCMIYHIYSETSI